jgi:hypothetical protein
MRVLLHAFAIGLITIALNGCSYVGYGMGEHMRTAVQRSASADAISYSYPIWDPLILVFLGCGLIYFGAKLISYQGGAFCNLAGS